jgi:protein-serine/threonine kinase
VLRLLGKGSFGVVQLVKSKDCVAQGKFEQHSEDLKRSTGCVYAMKVIRKSTMLKKSQEGHLRAERDFLVEASISAKWVVPLIESFQDTSHLYLVMEYMVGGDFLGLLLRYEVLTEEMTRFYIAEMVLAVEEVHKMKWIHRDVKPDNFLIDHRGHLKISDFGLAFDGNWCHNQKYYMETRSGLLSHLGIEVKGDALDVEEAAHRAAQPAASLPNSSTPSWSLLANRYIDPLRPKGIIVIESLDNSQRRKMARTIVGTSQYMAPEVILGLPYDGRCD